MPRPLPPPGPERDRAIAAQPRYGFRCALPIDALVDQWLGSDEAKRARRLARVAGAMAGVLDARTRRQVRPVRFATGTLTIEVANSVLLGELRQHHEHALIDALARAGTGVTRLAWRVAARRT